MKYLKPGVLILILCMYAVYLPAQSVEMRQLPAFSKLKTGGSWDVVIKKGDSPEVKLESKNLDLDRVVTEVKNNTLDVYLQKGNYRNVDLKVFITYVDLESIQSSGSGNFKSQSDLQASDLEISLSGSGDASFENIDADDLSIRMSGSGNVHIKGGNIGNVEVEQSGSGNFRAIDLHAEQANISKSGSGNVSLGVDETLSVRSSGSGNVQYRGNPSVNDVRISGSGRVVKDR